MISDATFVWAAIIGTFILGMIDEIYKDLKKADAEFDLIANTAIESHPHAFIHVRREWYGFITRTLAVTIRTVKDAD